MKLTKRQIKKIARLHSAIHLSYVDYQMFHELCEEINDDDRQAIIDEVHALSEWLAKGMPMNIGSTKGIIDYVVNGNSHETNNKIL